MEDRQMNRVYVTAVAFDRGLISVVEPDGKMGYYSQRGVGKLDKNVFFSLVRKGHLRKDIWKFKEFPKDYSLVNEDPEALGRIFVTFNLDRLR